MKANLYQLGKEFETDGYTDVVITIRGDIAEVKYKKRGKTPVDEILANHVPNWNIKPNYVPQVKFVPTVEQIYDKLVEFEILGEEDFI